MNTPDNWYYRTITKDNYTRVRVCEKYGGCDVEMELSGNWLPDVAIEYAKKVVEILNTHAPYGTMPGQKEYYE